MAKTPEIDLRENFGKNYIINGDMRIAQRNTSFTSIADSTYNLDRYVYFKTGAMVHNLTQDTDFPTLAQSGYLFQNSLRLNLTTPDTTIAAGDRIEISQIMEGYNWANLAQKPFTISFWVKATLTGTYCVYFRNNGADRSYVAEYTINVTNTWEYKTITISASPSAGTWNYTNGIGLRIGWTLAAGSTFQTTAGAWQTGNFLATANQVNGVNTGATDFRLTGIMINEGLQSLPFRLFGQDFEGELAACQRYYEKTYDLNIAVGADNGNGRLFEISSASAEIDKHFDFKVRKRAVPIVTFANVQAITSGPTATNHGETGFGVNGNTAAANQNYQYHWIADAEL